jgi:nicotinamidase-related amidase
MKDSAMTTYPTGKTALLCVDPYNDFLAEDGKMWPALSEVSRAVDLHANLVKIRAAMRDAGHPIFILPHHRHRDGDFEGWAHLTPFQAAAHEHQMFAEGSKGGDFYEGFGPDDGDIVVKEHWGASSFANTDLDVQLRQRGITHVIFVGAIANTCTEASARYAAELGYHVTLVRDATAAFSLEGLQAAHDINGPTYAHAIHATAEFLTALAGDRAA